MQETLGWLEATIEIESLFEGTDYSSVLLLLVLVASSTLRGSLHGLLRNSRGLVEKCLRERGSERRAKDLVLAGGLS